VSATKAEQIVDLVVARLGTVDGTGTYDTDLRGRVYSADQMTPTAMATTPKVVVGFDSISPGAGLRERDVAISIDVFADADYAAARGITARALLLRMHSDIDAAMYLARYSASLISHQRFVGAAIHRAEDGGTLNGLTMRFDVTYSELGEDEEVDPPPEPPMVPWPNENATRFHDGALRVQPVWMVKHGDLIRYCVSRDEMLTFDQSSWHKLFAYVLRAPQNITPANLTGDTLMDRPEWGARIYRNAAWDRLGHDPMDGIAEPVFRTLLPSPNIHQLQKAGVQPLYIPRVGQSDLFIGYGWLHNATTRHTLREEVVASGDVVHTLRFGMTAGATLVQWEVADATLGVSRNIVNSAESGFGREIQVALHTIDFNEPPSPTDTGQQNPTQGGSAYGNYQNGNGMSPPEAHPLGPNFRLEGILACGSPVASFTVRDEPLGGKSFDAVTCPLNFQSDRYGAEINRDTVLSRTGEVFPCNPVIWPTTLFRTRVWAAYKGDARVVRYDSWLDTAIDWTCVLNPYYPQIQTAFVALNQDRTGWFNRAHFFDPATQVATDITADADLWASAQAVRKFLIGREGVYRTHPSPVARWGDCPFTTRHSSIIYESQADGLCFGFYCNVADNQDATRQQELEVVSHPSPTAFPSATAADFGLMTSSDDRHQNRATGVNAKPDTTPPGVHGPWTTFFVVGSLAIVKAKIRALYIAGELP
jgi:hypothetical protein